MGKIKCDCGSIVSEDYYYQKHKETKKHLKYVESLKCPVNFRAHLRRRLEQTCLDKNIVMTEKEIMERIKSMERDYFVIDITQKKIDVLDNENLTEKQQNSQIRKLELLLCDDLTFLPLPNDICENIMIMKKQLEDDDEFKKKLK